MPLNIKDEALRAQARRLAGLTGVSIAAVVREAVARQLDHIERGGEKSAPVKSAEKLMELAQVRAGALKSTGVTSDHSHLYGENGLPR